MHNIDYIYISRRRPRLVRTRSLRLKHDCTIRVPNVTELKLMESQLHPPPTAIASSLIKR